jgi:hypothetical protein
MQLMMLSVDGMIQINATALFVNAFEKGNPMLQVRACFRLVPWLLFLWDIHCFFVCCPCYAHRIPRLSICVTGTW